MGCTYDVIQANIKKEHKNKFIELFNKVLAEDIYDDEWCVADEGCFEDDGERSEFGIDAEPLFAMMDNGEQLIPFFKKFLAECPDEEFTAEYECTFNNCAAMAIINVTFDGETMTIRRRYAETGYITECPDCGYEDEDGEDLFTLHDYEEGQELTCPSCGAVLDIEDASEDIETVNVFESDDYDWEESDDIEEDED